MRQNIVFLSLLLLSTKLHAMNAATSACLLLLKAERETAKQFLKQDMGWGSDGHTEGDYDFHFSKLLGPVGTFDKLAEARKAAGKTTHTVEFMGSGVFMADPKYFSSIIGMRLGARDGQYLQNQGAAEYAPQRSEVYGNGYDSSTWGKLDARMKEKNIPHIDYFVARPLGGINQLEEGARELGKDAEEGARLLFKRVANNAWARLNPDGGQIYTQVPSLYMWTKEGRAQFNLWLQSLSAHQIDYKLEEGNLLLTRRPESPAKLPDLVIGARKQSVVPIKLTMKDPSLAIQQSIAAAKVGDEIAFVIPKEIEIICPFQNLCGTGVNKVEVFLGTWLESFGRAQDPAGKSDFQTVTTGPHWTVVVYKKSQHQVALPSLVDVGDGNYVPAPAMENFRALQRQTPVAP